MKLSGLIEIEPLVHKDLRGFFLESYHQARYRELGVKELFLQDNHSFSKKGVIRGMHFQKGQAKLIYCPVGQIFDVVVDIRRDSTTFGQWQGFYLDDKNNHQLYIPDGFAHGFCVLSNEAHVMYKVSSMYDKELEKGFSVYDREVKIQWPVKNPILSDRDKNAPCMKEMV